MRLGVVVRRVGGGRCASDEVAVDPEDLLCQIDAHATSLHDGIVRTPDWRALQHPVGHVDADSWVGRSPSHWTWNGSRGVLGYSFLHSIPGLAEDLELWISWRPRGRQEDGSGHPFNSKSRGSVCTQDNRAQM